MTIDPNSPAITLSAIPPAWERKIESRWKELEPHARIKHNLRLGDEMLEYLRKGHRLWLISLLRDGIQMRVIRRLKLDDIREPPAILECRAQAHKVNSQHPRYTERKSPHVPKQ